ncbi:MAG TPA: type II secretion system protein [Anaerohalosphaeraceae bacterium]|nr:type II secretion system protein [Anaerohalosphaeraceae bacterium]HOL31890.1 type II secretion system protein [Anaerohalosphaeraceae bacterium]HOM75741.1 type II secretion system protein [Anaerohalosphaeraceae bacterium]HPC64457.1 type II secretion system protein [Anaerohalosphaeraceae bacterium]HPO69711.1 type II secretion system protein [Anaerohalosphaeraceae bacterium]
MTDRKGFTLIELLTVIGITALLLAVAAPSLLLAKEQARGIYCRSNLKQMCAAAAAYAMNSDDYYPIAYYQRFSAGQDGSALLPQEPPGDCGSQALSEAISFSFCWDFTAVITADGRRLIRPGLLWQSDTLEKVHQCPSYKGSDNWSGNPYTGYNYNTSYIGHGQGETVNPAVFTGIVKSAQDASGQSIVMPARTSHVRNPSSCVIFGEGHYAGGANKLMRSPFVWEGDTDWDVRTGGTQGYRHMNQTNIGWAAGHVTAQRELYTDTHPRYKSQLEAFNCSNKIKIGFLSPDNSLYDLK